MPCFSKFSVTLQTESLLTETSGPGCSTLMRSLVKVALKFQMFISEIF